MREFVQVEIEQPIEQINQSDMRQIQEHINDHKILKGNNVMQYNANCSLYRPPNYILNRLTQKQTREEVIQLKLKQSLSSQIQNSQNVKSFTIKRPVQSTQKHNKYQVIYENQSIFTQKQMLLDQNIFKDQLPYRRLNMYQKQQEYLNTSLSNVCSQQLLKTPTKDYFKVQKQKISQLQDTQKYKIGNYDIRKLKIRTTSSPSPKQRKQLFEKQ